MDARFLIARFDMSPNMVKGMEDATKSYFLFEAYKDACRYAFQLDDRQFQRESVSASC